MNKTIIQITKQSDRDVLILALVNSGYTVRYSEVKVDGQRRAEKLIEYWKEEE